MIPNVGIYQAGISCDNLIRQISKAANQFKFIPHDRELFPRKPNLGNFLKKKKNEKRTNRWHVKLKAAIQKGG